MCTAVCTTYEVVLSGNTCQSIYTVYVSVFQANSSVVSDSLCTCVCVCAYTVPKKRTTADTQLLAVTLSRPISEFFCWQACRYICNKVTDNYSVHILS